MEANSFFFMYVAGTLGSCVGALLFLYNVVGLVSFMREDTGGESASMLAKAAWAIGFLSGLLGPCMWFGAVIALILARVERGRIYAEKSPLAGATPCRMASVNGGLMLVIWVVFTAGALSTWAYSG